MVLFCPGVNLLVHHHLMVYPFTAIVGQELMKEALILNAINPKIGGVLIKGEKGTAKSTAARALTELLPDIEVVDGCPFNCDPRDLDSMCTRCKARVEAGETLPVATHHMKMVTLPVSATEDRVVGTIDLKKALADKELALEPGILADVNRGILYIDEVNLLENHVADLLLDAAAMGYNIIERENISYYHPSRFILIGTMNPEEGDLRPQLLDRFGLCIEVTGEADLARRVAIIKARQEFDTDREAFQARYRPAQLALRERMTEAKARLATVTVPERFLHFASLVCIKLGVDGHRADIVIIKTAKTLAAFKDHARVLAEDVKRACVLSLPHRLRKGPFSTRRFDPAEFDDFLEETMREVERMDLPEAAFEDAPPPELEAPPETEEPPPELEAPPETEASPGTEVPLEQDTTHEQETGSREEVLPPAAPPRAPGRPVPPLSRTPRPRDVGPPPREVFEIGAGLAHRARKELLEKHVKGNLQQTKARRGDATTYSVHGRYARARKPRPTEKLRDLALDATLRASVVDAVRQHTALQVTPEHYRVKVRKSPVNVLIIFVLDASGSMAANRRMAAAKGAIFSLLQEIYVRKDKVALVTFAGSEARLILPPTNSVELAQERLRELPTGGKTPLSAGLYKAVQLAIAEQRTRGLVPLVVLLSDGKQNIPLSTSFAEDKDTLADLIAAHKIPLVCIDTDLARFNLGFARELADQFDAVYYELDRLQSDSVARIIRKEYQDVTRVLEKI